MGANEQWARRWVELTAGVISDNRELLIDLDRQIGDGDHGENLDRGFSAVVRGDGLNEAETAGDIMKYVAKTLLSTVGGAAGPLYGTAYLRAVAAIPEDEIQSADVAKILDASVKGVQARGKAVAGEKTMVDAWLPAVEAAREAAEAGEDVAATFAAAALAAKDGSDATEPMKATKGRASYLGERSIGHIDPGSVSSALILQAAADAAAEVFASDSAS